MAPHKWMASVLFCVVLMNVGERVHGGLLSPIASCGYSASPGVGETYKVINNITVNGFSDCFTLLVGSQDTIVDGQHYTITCTGDCAGIAAIAYLGRNSLTVKNLNFVGWGFGVVLRSNPWTSVTVVGCTFNGGKDSFGVAGFTNSSGTFNVTSNVFTGVYAGVYTEATNENMQVLNSIFNDVIYGVYVLDYQTKILVVSNCGFFNGNESIINFDGTIQTLSVDNIEVTNFLYGIHGYSGFDSAFSAITVTDSTFTSVDAAIFYENHCNSVNISGNWFYDVGYAGTTFNAATVNIQGNHIRGRLQTMPETIVAFQTNFGTTSTQVTGNTVINHCLGIFATASIIVQNNYVSGCNFTAITVFGDASAANFQVIGNHIENGASRIAYESVTLGQFPTGIFVRNAVLQGSVTIQDNVVNDYTVGCNSSFWGIYAILVDTFTLLNNTVQSIHQEDTGGPCMNVPYIIGMGIESMGNGQISDSKVDTINSSIPSFCVSGVVTYRTIGMRVLNTLVTTISSTTISNIRANDAPTCTGCDDNWGNNALGLVVWGTNVTTNVTTNGVTINGIYGGKGGQIKGPLPNSLSTGGDAVGIFVNNYAYLTTINTVLENVLGGNGGPFPNADYYSCGGGKGYAIYDTSDIVHTAQEISIRDGQACTASLIVTGCSIYSNLPENFTLTINGDITVSNATDHCIYIQNSTDVRIVGNNFKVSCSGNCKFAGIFLYNVQTVSIVQVSLSGWAEANVIIYGVSYFSASQSSFGVSAYGITESSINPFPVTSYELVANSFVNCVATGLLTATTFYINSNSLSNPANSTYGFTVVATGHVEFSYNYASNAALGSFTLSQGGNFTRNTAIACYNLAIGISNLAGDLFITQNTIQYVHVRTAYIAEAGGISVSCANKMATAYYAENKITDTQVDCGTTAYGILNKCDNVRMINNTIANLYTNSQACIPPLIAGIYHFQVVNGTMVGNVIDGILNTARSTQPPSSFNFVPRAMGLYFIESTVDVSQTIINDVRGPNGLSCAQCDASGFSAAALVINADPRQPYSSSSISVNNMNITNIYGGNGADILVTPETNQTSLGGDSVAFYIIGNASLTYSSVLAQNFTAGNGGKVTPGNHTVCGGGIAATYEGFLNAPSFDNTSIVPENFVAGLDCVYVAGVSVCGTTNGGCDRHVVCVDTSSGVKCPPCPIGFNGSSTTACFPLCGDSICDASINETCVSCPFDCLTVTCNACGDGKCDSNEDCTNCFEDCHENCVIDANCIADCSGNGNCNEGVCECTGNWNGPACNLSNAQSKLQSNSTDPVVSLSTANSLYQISIPTVEERDKTGFAVESHSLMGDFAKHASDDSLIFSFTKILENLANINITIQQFTDVGSVFFANKTTQYPANSVKLTISVTNWPFKSLENSLTFKINTGDPTQKTQACNVDTDKDYAGNLNWYTLTFNGIVMYGTFTSQCVADSRIRGVQFKLEDDNSVSATVPHFWDAMQLDPTFSVLLGQTEDPCSHKSLKSSVPKTILIAVLVPVGVLLILAVLAYFIVPRFFLKRQVQKEQGVMMSRLSSSPKYEKRDRL